MIRVGTAFPVYFVSGAFYMGYSACALGVPLRAKELGANAAFVGLLVALILGTGAVLAIPAGRIGDRFGNRRILLLALALSLGAQAVLALSDSLTPMLAGQLLAGLSLAACHPILYATVADLVPRADLGRSIGALSLTTHLGMIGGPAVGGLLLGISAPTAVLWLGACLSIVALLLAAAVVPRTTAAHTTTGRTPVGPILRQRAYLVLAISTIAICVTMSTFQTYGALLAREVLYLDPPSIGYLLALVAAANAAGRAFGGRFVSRPSIAVGILGPVGAVALMIAPFTSGFWVPAALLSLGTVSLAVAVICVSATFAILGDASNRTMVMGTFSTLSLAFVGLPPLVVGPIIDRAGYGAAFILTGSIGITLVAVAFKLGFAPDSAPRTVPEHAVPA